MTLTLHQFEFSHFNEKARWALAYKGVEHARRNYLPGPHMGPIKKLSSQTQTPVLERSPEVIAGSAAIIDWLETHYPDNPLYPTDSELRSRALDYQTRFDRELGPAVRTLVFNSLLKEMGYIAAMFGRSQSAPKRALYRAMLPVVKPIIAKGNGVNPSNVTLSLKIVDNYLNEIGHAAAETGYLVGDRFSVADLAGAALLAPILTLDHHDMARPKPIPESLLAIARKYEDTPAVAWGYRMFETHRPG